tara:strand:- start:703 stop:891 length:189 start_codon:yes stop_codon:yes gene_type:complete
MTRPHKIKEPTVTYNVNLQTRYFKKLQKIAFIESFEKEHQVAVADLIRLAIGKYLKDYKHEI